MFYMHVSVEEGKAQRTLILGECNDRELRFFPLQICIENQELISSSIDRIKAVKPIFIHFLAWRDLNKGIGMKHCVS